MRAVCARCRGNRPAFRAVRSAFVYGGVIRDAVHALKFDGVSALAEPMAQSMTQALLGWSPPVEAVVPVPLSPGRKRRRGYNQSELLARAVARATGLRLETKAILRRRDTPPQARQQDERSRRQNVREAFRPGRARLSGGVLLVDDVVTTGATLDACARALLAAGASRVFALTYARED